MAPYFLDCLGHFTLAISGGYFKFGHIDKGVMSSKSKCACACNENINCVVFGFRDDNLKCYHYEGVSIWNQQTVDANVNNYIKNGPGNNSLWMYSLLKRYFYQHWKF